MRWWERSRLMTPTKARGLMAQRCWRQSRAADIWIEPGKRTGFDYPLAPLDPRFRHGRL